MDRINLDGPKYLRLLLAFLIFILFGTGFGRGLKGADDRAVFPANPDIKIGKKAVLVSGDEEYRTEEYFTQLAKILSRRHGFDCVVLYAVDPATGKINPDINTNIPGLEELRDADCLILSTRRRALPDEQIQEFDDYLRTGRPVLAARCATHAFMPPETSRFFYYSDLYDGDEMPEWKGGFGRKILGEHWISHHGNHAHEATRAIAAPGAEQNPVLTGVEPIFVPSDVYAVRFPMQNECHPILLGQVLDGMMPESRPVENEKNNPLMPVAWYKTYRLDESSPEGTAITTTLGSSVDFLDENFRRFLVNAVYVLCGLTETMPARADVGFIGDYQPTMFGFGTFQPSYNVLPKELEQ